MKEILKYFEQRRYSSVNGDVDEEAAMMQNSSAAAPAADPVVVTPTHRQCDVSTLAEKQQRRKSLKANRCSMNPANILSSFFNERPGSRGARSPKCAFVLLTAGVVALAVAILVKIIHPYDLIFKWKLVMTEGGEIFNLWAQPPVDLYIKIYLFNITNAEAFLEGRERMNVQQVGPYTYKEIMTHKNISFNENNTISTKPSHPLVWQEHMSEGNREEDEVVMLNIAMLAISHLTAEKSYFFRMALNTLFVTSKSLPIVRMTAKEFMFGYQSSLTTLGNTFLPNWISFEKVGLIDRMYDFDSDFETFHNGIPDPSISGLYATYRGSPNLPQWDGDYCSNIELASDGTKFKSFIQPNESIKFFRKSMCRPMNLFRQGEAKTYGSLSGYKYVFENNALDNGVYNQHNKCFCRKGLCQPSGLIDVTDCYYGFPISLSYPHFMEGDPGLQHNITGLTPNKENHSSTFVIQPESGLPLSISVKVQINMHFNDLSSIRKVSQFSHLTAPMLWFEIMMPELPPALETRFNFYLNILPYLDPVGFWGGLLLGLALLVYAVTRATLRMSNFPSSATAVLSDGLLYSKANLITCTGTSSVYKPCEMKLMTTNEKHDQPQHGHEHHFVTRQISSGGGAGGDVEGTSDILYTEIATERPQTPQYALEMEPATISDSTDEGNESDPESISHNSTTSSSGMDEQDCDGDGDGEDYSESQHTQDDNKTFISFGSSGLASSINSRNVALSIKSGSNQSNNNGRWSSTSNCYESNTASTPTTARDGTRSPKSTQQIDNI